jgi:hypothetical protein
MKRFISVFAVMAVVAATAMPAFAQTGEEFSPDISVRSGQPGDPVWGYFTSPTGARTSSGP